MSVELNHIKTVRKCQHDAATERYLTILYEKSRAFFTQKMQSANLIGNIAMSAATKSEL